MKNWKNFNESLIEELDTITDKVHHTIQNLINEKGVDSEHRSEKCLKIDKDDFMFNLIGGRWLTEISNDSLIDNEGYDYDYNALEIEKLAEIADYYTEN